VRKREEEREKKRKEEIPLRNHVKNISCECIPFSFPSFFLLIDCFLSSSLVFYESLGLGFIYVIVLINGLKYEDLTFEGIMKHFCCIYNIFGWLRAINGHKDIKFVTFVI